MSTFTLLMLAIALGADAFSLSVGIGMARITYRQILIISITVLVFHIFMPIIGFYIGDVFGSLIGKFANYLGAAILIFLGGKMLKEAFVEENEENKPNVLVMNTVGLVVLAGSVSLDALSVGFTLGTQQVNLFYAALVIGIVAGLMTAAGLGFGRQIGKWLGSKAEIIGGVILIGIGIKLLF